MSEENAELIQAKEMLSDAVVLIELVAEFLGVSREPHQNFQERLLNAASSRQLRREFADELKSTAEVCTPVKVNNCGNFVITDKHTIADIYRLCIAEGWFSEMISLAEIDGILEK